MQMQDQEKSADCSRHCRPGNQLTAQTIGRLFPLAKTYTNTNILIHIEKNKHKRSSTLCCSLFLRGVRQRAGPYVRKREESPSGEANIAKPFSMLVAEERRSPLVQRLLVFPLVDARLSLQPENVPYLNISQLISITCTFPGSLLAGGLALPGSKVSDDHRKLSDIYCTECPKKVDDAWINWEARICGHFGPFWSF